MKVNGSLDIHEYIRSTNCLKSVQNGKYFCLSGEILDLSVLMVSPAVEDSHGVEDA